MKYLGPALCLILVATPAMAQPAPPARPTGAQVDYHVHPKGGLTVEDALRRSRETGIYYGLAINGGLGQPAENDAALEAFLRELDGKPVYKAMQAEGREWVRMFSKATLEKFDYVFTDSMTWTDDNGKRMRLWIPEEVGTVADPQKFMDMLVGKRCRGQPRSTPSVRGSSRTAGAAWTRLGSPLLRQPDGAQLYRLSGRRGFMRALGTRNRYSATSVDQLPHHLAAWAMYGHQLALPIPDLDRTDFLLVLGANPVTSNGSLMTAPDVTARLKAIASAAGTSSSSIRVATETARLADEHHFIRPGTDALLLAALAREIIAAGLAKPGRLAAMSTGYEALPRLLDAFTPLRLGRHPRLPADHP